MNLRGGWVGKENWVRITNNSPMLFHESEEEKSVKRSRKLKWNRHKGKYYTDFNYVTALKKNENYSQ